MIVRDPREAVIYTDSWFPRVRSDDWCGEWAESIDTTRERIRETNAAARGESLYGGNRL